MTTATKTEVINAQMRNKAIVELVKAGLTARSF